jgi:F-type H+-transporting ATPase subunit gamma
VAQEQVLKRRIRSVRNAKQITKALEVVAAGRMRKVQGAVENSRAYGNLADAIIRRVAPSQEAQQHSYFKPAPERSKKLYIVFTSDRGQAGAFNSNILHLVTQNIQADREAGQEPSVIVFGKKGARFFARVRDINLLGTYTDVEDIPETNIFAPVIDSIEHGINNGDFSSVVIIYTQFISALVQKAQAKQLLPITVPEAGTNNAGSNEEIDNKVYEFEPSLESVLEEALRLYFEASLMQARIESAASEHSMRMIAMGNANRNAGDLIDNLTLELNATRQAAITQEIAEITGGAAAIAT